MTAALIHMTILSSRSAALVTLVKKPNFASSWLPSVLPQPADLPEATADTSQFVTLNRPGSTTAPAGSFGPLRYRPSRFSPLRPQQLIQGRIPIRTEDQTSGSPPEKREEQGGIRQ